MADVCAYTTHFCGDVGWQDLTNKTNWRKCPMEKFDSPVSRPAIAEVVSAKLSVFMLWFSP